MICPGCGLELAELDEHIDHAHGGVSVEELGKQHRPRESTPGVDQPVTETSKGGVVVVRERSGPYL